jgi:hypothetical protein
VIFEIFTAVRMVMFFIFRAEDEDSMVLRNASIYQQVDTAPKPRRSSSNEKLFFSLGFEVLKAVNTKMAVFWVIVPCSLVEVYQRFRCPCCLYHQGVEQGPLKRW